MKNENSELRKAAMAGKKLEGELIIDAHAHIGGLAKWCHLPEEDSTQEMIYEMDRVGIETAITSSLAGTSSDFVFGNNQTAAETLRHPDRFIGLATVNPHYHTEMRDELERCRAMGLRGIKLTPEYQRYAPEGPNLFAAYEYAHEHSWIMLSHNWGSPLFLDKLATTFANACFIIGHYAGATYAEITARHANIFQCTCGTLSFGDVEALVDTVPAEKIIFGSDFPDLPIMFSMGPILYSRINDDDKRKILGLTARGIIERWRGNG